MDKNKSDITLLSNADVVINFAISPAVFTPNFKDDDNIDLWLANQLQFFKHVHFIMISTRQVYGDSLYLSESMEPNPMSVYGNNKLNIENSVAELIDPARLTILRCSNVFGFEVGRKTFFGSILSSLIANSFILFNISAKTTKDFISVSDFTEVIAQVVKRKLAGIYNVGSGIDIECGILARSVITGFTKGRLIADNDVVMGQFSMDISKLKSSINYPNVSKKSIRESAHNLGVQLKELAITRGIF